MNKQPKLMNFSRMSAIFEPHHAQLRDNIFINRELAILRGNLKVFQLIARQKPPFIIDDHRLGIIIKGSIKVNMNLVEKELVAGMLVFVGPGSIISPISISPDLEIYGFGLSADFPLPFATDQLPPAFNGQARDFQLPVGEADIATARLTVELLWHVVHQPNYNQQTVGSIVAAQMHHYDGLYRQHKDLIKGTQARSQTIFDRFLYLVNRHCRQEHHVGYYAERMCLTERYLGTIIRHTSGATAKEWIDRALITHAKVMLRHTNHSAADISHELHFPNPSFFSKYFKRQTGMTPQQYRIRA